MFLANKLNMGAGSPAAPADAQFNYVTMLLHGDGTNGAQNNTFVDSSSNNFTITRNGNTTQGSFSPYGSNWSNNFTGTTGNYLTISNNAAFTLGQTFTVECWLYRTESVDGTIVGRWYAGDASGWLMHIFSSGKLAFGTGAGSYSNASASTIPLNTWTHLAVSNDATSKRFYINGVLDATFTSDNINILGSINLTICQNTGGGYGIPSYISNLRIVKGTALYTSNFTPSTTSLTAVSGTSLLTCQSNRFIDNSTNAFAITVSGTPSVQRFNPFGTSTAYSTSVIGGSGYFDGSGDYLQTPTSSAFAFGTGDFTSELWVYLSRSNATIIYEPRTSSNESNPCIAYGVVTANKFEVADSGIIITSSSTFGINQWHHVAIVRSGTTLTLWVNGTNQGSTTLSANLTNNDRIRIGEYFTAGTYALQGYVSNLRVVKGTAVYTSAFTPSTTPLTAISGTSLLTSMTNGAIFDNAMMNDLETVGNAQISTSVVKYGTGSLAFDGTGDSLSVLNTPTSTVWGTESWTIEGWIYPTAVSSSYRTIYANGFPVQIFQTGGSVEIYISSTNGYSYIVNGLTGPASSVTANTWVHFAVVKNGSAYRVYVNGVGGSTVTDSTAIALTSTPNAIIGDAPFGSYPFVGYMDDLRITKGYARYTANFTPPTAAFPNIGPV